MDGLVTNLLDYWWVGALVVFAIYLLNGLNIVAEWDRVPVMRFGKYATTLGPGITWLEPFSHRRLDAVDIREEVNAYTMGEGTSLQTHDNVPISFVTMLTSNIDAENVKKYILAFDGEQTVGNRTLAAVSEVISATELNKLLHEREVVCAAIKALLITRIAHWGINIVAVELRDIKITDESIQEAIAMKARAGKEAEAEMVRAEAQVAIAKELTLAAEELSEGGWKLKGMEVMTEMTRSADNNTVIIPSDIVQGIARIMNPLQVVPRS